MSAPVGTIYSLLNASFPGYVKVGCTTGCPIERARQLSASSGVPTPFVVGYHRYVADPFKVEALLHKILAPHRVNDSREFFALPLYKVVELMDRFEEIAVPSETPWADLFNTFPDDGSSRELTADESAQCRALEERLGAAQ